MMTSSANPTYSPSPPSSSQSSAGSSASTSHSLHIVQHNCRGSNSVFLSLFSSFKRSPPDIVAIQDPYLFHGLPLRALDYILISPSPPTSFKIYVYIYISVSFQQKVFFLTHSFPQGNI